MSKSSQAIVQMRFHSNGELIAAASSDKSCIVYKNHGEVSTKLVGHSLGLNDCVWLNDVHLCSCSDDKTIKIWDLEASTCVTTLIGHKSFVYSLAVNPVNGTILSGGCDGTLRLFDTRLSGSVSVWEAHSEPISSIDFDYSGCNFVTGSLDGLARIWRWNSLSPSCVFSLHKSKPSPISRVSYSYNGLYLLVGSLDDEICLFESSSQSRRYDARASRPLRRYRGHSNKKYCVFSAIVAGNEGQTDPRVVSGSEDGKVYLWHVDDDTKEPLVFDTGTVCPVFAIACNPSASGSISMAAGTSDGKAVFWTREQRLQMEAIHLSALVNPLVLLKLCVEPSLHQPLEL